MHCLCVCVLFCVDMSLLDWNLAASILVLQEWTNNMIINPTTAKHRNAMLMHNTTHVCVGFRVFPRSRFGLLLAKSRVGNDEWLFVQPHVCVFVCRFHGIFANIWWGLASPLCLWATIEKWTIGGWTANAPFSARLIDDDADDLSRWLVQIMMVQYICMIVWCLKQGK